MDSSCVIGPSPHQHISDAHYALLCRTMKHMQKRLRDNELRILRGEQEVDESQVDNDSADASPLSSEASFVQRARQPAAGFVSLSQPPQAQPTDRGWSTEVPLGWLSTSIACNEQLVRATRCLSRRVRGSRAPCLFRELRV